MYLLTGLIDDTVGIESGRVTFDTGSQCTVSAVLSGPIVPL
jgi:hypothetical protein